MFSKSKSSSKQKLLIDIIQLKNNGDRYIKPSEFIFSVEGEEAIKKDKEFRKSKLTK